MAKSWISKGVARLFGYATPFASKPSSSLQFPKGHTLQEQTEALACLSMSAAATSIWACRSTENQRQGNQDDRAGRFFFFLQVAKPLARQSEAHNSLH